jgi:MoaA/NifB/PqqE/SkfB family radical SAM enzyme
MITSLKRPLTKLLRGASFQTDYGILRPSTISISMTNRCNSRCPTCSYWKADAPRNELSTLEWKQILSSIRDWYGPFQFSIGGGEPLIRADICEVIEHTIDIGCRPSVITNGLLLSRKTISSLVDAGLEEIVLSLNGIKEETHDATRGIPGGFTKIMEAIQELKIYGSRLSIGIATVLMGFNMAEAEALVKWVKSNALERITFQALFYETGNRNYQRDWYKESSLWISEGVNPEEVIDGLIGLKKSGYPIANPLQQLHHFKPYFQDPNRVLPVPCKIGIHGFFVEPEGAVKLCYLFDPVGNLLEDAPGKIWNARRARKIRKMIRNCRLNCRLKNCNYVKE